MVALAIPYADINGRRFAAFPNPNLLNKDGAPKTTWDHLVEFTKSASGAFRVFQLFERISKLVAITLKQLGSTMAGFFEDLAGKLGLAWTMLTIPRLPEVTKTAKKAIDEWINPPAIVPLDVKRDNLQKIHDVADAAAAWGYAASLVTGNTTIKQMADIPDLVTNLTDLQMAAQDWTNAKEHIKALNAGNEADKVAVHNRFVDTLRLALLKLVKAVSSVASGVLGLLVLGLGGPVVPAVVLVLISLSSTLAAVSSRIFEQTCNNEVVEFHKIKNPAVLVAGAPAA